MPPDSFTHIMPNVLFYLYSVCAVDDMLYTYATSGQILTAFCWLCTCTLFTDSKVESNLIQSNIELLAVILNLFLPAHIPAGLYLCSYLIFTSSLFYIIVQL